MKKNLMRRALLTLYYVITFPVFIPLIIVALIADFVYVYIHWLTTGKSIENPIIFIWVTTWYLELGEKIYPNH